jgi:hypothetical protein
LQPGRELQRRDDARLAHLIEPDVGEALAVFLGRAARTPFVWGTFDCCLWLADWVLERRGVDPAADLRGRYASELGCARLLKRRGGLPAVVSDCAELARLAPTSAPLAGDVGVILGLTPTGETAVGALCTGPRWSILTVAGGIASVPARVLYAWSV